MKQKKLLEMPTIKWDKDNMERFIKKYPLIKLTENIVELPNYQGEIIKFFNNVGRDYVRYLNEVDRKIIKK